MFQHLETFYEFLEPLILLFIAAFRYLASEAYNTYVSYLLHYHTLVAGVYLKKVQGLRELMDKLGEVVTPGPLSDQLERQQTVRLFKVRVVPVCIR